MVGKEWYEEELPQTAQIQAVSIAALEDFAFSNVFKGTARRSHVEVLVASSGVFGLLV